MRSIIVFLAVAIFFTRVEGQSLDSSIANIANDIAERATKKSKGTLALTDFVNVEGKVDGLTDYIREELELKLINAQNVMIIDRRHLKLLLTENKLQSDGLIDERTARSAIGYIKIDGWIIAEITTLDGRVKIKVKVIDVNTSQIYAASTSSLISDVAIDNLLNPVNICSECEGKGVVQIQTTCATCNGKGNYACRSCRGSGHLPGMTVGSYVRCEGCNGDGKINCSICSGTGRNISYRTCSKCNGKVQLSSTHKLKNSTKLEICPECNGVGKIKSEMNCTHCGGSGQGPLVHWTPTSCSFCLGKGKITSYNICQRCNSTGKL